MNNQNKTKQQLLAENEELRRRLRELETPRSGTGHGEWQSAPEDSQWHSLVANAPVVIIVVDESQCIRYINHTDSGASTDLVLGRPLYDFCRAEDRESVRKCVEQVFRTGQPCVGEYAALRLDDQQHWYASHFGPIFADGRVVAVSLISSNITKQKRAEEALKKTRDELEQRVEERTAELSAVNDQLRAIYDGMVDGLHILDLATMRPVRANSALCRMMGYSEEEALSLSPRDVHPPEELAGIQEKFQACLEGRAFGASEIPLVRKDGSVFYADVTASRILYNEVPCMMCFFRDTTERRKAQQALERERQSLWRMLQASDHERQVISYEIHDGLAQYLAAATMQFHGYEAFRESSPDKAKKAYDAGIELVRLAHSETRRLISDVRPPVIDENGLETAISHLVHEQRQRGRPKVEFRSNVRFRRLPVILENSLYRIGQEALTNACKYSNSTKVKVTLAQKGRDVRLEVQDWGIGFDPQSVEKGHFGLEGIRQRVRLLGGRLSIESVRGAGTLVQVVVPLLEKQDADSRPVRVDEWSGRGPS